MCSSHGPELPELKTNRRLKYAVALNCIFVVLEFAAGVLSGSLALVTDSIHNAVDSLTLALAFLAGWVSQRPADKFRTYGYHRAKVLIALANAVILVFVLAGIGYLALQRFADPQPIDALVMVATGMIGVVCNLGVVLILRPSSKEMHVRGAYLHNLTDAASSLLLGISGVVIYLTGAYWVDLALSLGLCLMLAKSLIPIFRDSVHILLEGAPDGVDIERVAERILSFPEVSGVHDLHTWAQSDGMSSLTCHVVVRKEVPHERDHDLVDRLRAVLRDEFGVAHTTIQVEHEDCEQATSCRWDRHD